MILVLDPVPPGLRWYAAGDAGESTGWIAHGPSWLDALAHELGGLDDITDIGYVLQNGGTAVRQTACQATSHLLDQLEGAVQFSPERNSMCLDMARAVMSRHPGARHLLLCETGFFAHMPDEAALYALPPQLTAAGVRRYGGQGLLHGWVWERARLHLGPGCQKLISVDLGDETSVAAIRDGEALETSLGFTPVEGIPSMISCGDIDPTVALQLAAEGLSVSEVGSLLSRESGFSGLVGRSVSLPGICREGAGDDLVGIRETLGHRILLQIGASAAVLGGADAIVFSSEAFPAAYGLACEICRGLQVFGVSCERVPAGDSHWEQLSSGGANPVVVGIPYRRPAVLLEALASRKLCAQSRVP